MTGRVWHYGYRRWRPVWWQYILPARGGDEYGRRTLVIPVHPFGFLVWAYWTCWCPDCIDMRIATAQREEEEREIAMAEWEDRERQRREDDRE